MPGSFDTSLADGAQNLTWNNNNISCYVGMWYLAQLGLPSCLDFAFAHAIYKNQNPSKVISQKKAIQVPIFTLIACYQFKLKVKVKSE